MIARLFVDPVTIFQKENKPCPGLILLIINSKRPIQKLVNHLMNSIEPEFAVCYCRFGGLHRAALTWTTKRASSRQAGLAKAFKLMLQAANTGGG